MAFDGMDDRDEPAPGVQRPRGLWHYVVSLILLFVGLHALGASLCGGFFLIGLMGEGGDGWVPVILAVAAPSVIVGGVIAFFCFRSLGRRWSSWATRSRSRP